VQAKSRKKPLITVQKLQTIKIRQILLKKIAKVLEKSFEIV